MSRSIGRPLWAGILVATVAITGFVAIRAPSPEPAHNNPTAGAMETGPAGTRDSSQVSAYPWPNDTDNAEDTIGADGLSHLPASLLGTEVDGHLQVDDQGHLVINHDVRRVFDYFLSVIDEESPQRVLARLRTYLAYSLPPTAAAEAERLLRNYLDYQQAAGEPATQTAISEGSLDPNELRLRLEQTSALQSQYLGPIAAEAFFGDENRYNDYMVSKLALIQRDDLDDETRDRQLANLQANLPPELREVTHSIQGYQDVRNQVQKMQADGASVADIYQVRANALGEEAAQRLQTLDHQRAQWQQRMDEWLKEKQRLESQTGLDSETRQSYINNQRQLRFSESELRRVMALERIQSQQ